jgi:hypothetical protein
VTATWISWLPEQTRSFRRRLASYPRPVDVSSNRWIAEYILTFQGQRRTMLSSSFGGSRVSPCHDVSDGKKGEARQIEQSQLTWLAWQLFLGGAQTTKNRGLAQIRRCCAMNLSECESLIPATSRLFSLLNRKRHGGNYAILLLIGSIRSLITLQF